MQLLPMTFKKGEKHIDILYLYLIENKDVQHKLEGKRMKKRNEQNLHHKQES